MAFVSVTRLRIRRWRYLPAFFYFTLVSLLQSRRSEGNLGTSVKKDAQLVFWTITLWRNESAMRRFRNQGAHRRAMPKLLEWCDEATYVHWQQDEATLPELGVAYERLAREGIVSKVRHPSPDHAARSFPPPKA